MKRRLGSSFILVLIIFSSLLTGLTGCKDLLVQKQVEGFAVSFVTPGTSSSRSADGGGANWNVTAWLELEDGTTLQSQKTTAVAGEPVSIAFEPVAAGTRLRVKVELVSTTDSSVKYSGTSNLIEVIPGENSVSLELSPVDAEPEEDTPPPDSEEEEKEEPVIVNAEAPKIETQPVGEIKPAAAGQATTVTKELTVKASISDGGNLTYHWYSSNTNSTEGGTKIEGATSSSYEATVAAKETKYFYCVVTNTNNSATGAKTASTTTNVVAVASVEGELTRITAKYTGEYELVNSQNYKSGITITQYYEGVEVGVEVNASSVGNDYTISDVPSNSIGNVPVTITSNTAEGVEAQVTIPVKYELDTNYLTITGDTSVEQNGDLVLTAEYKVDGNDVQYKLYGTDGSSNSYKVIEKVSISWTGATQQPNKWEALAETNTAGSKNATVKLSTGDEWCVTTDGIQANHQYMVNVATTNDGYYVSANGDDSAVGTYDAPFKTLAHAITQAHSNDKTIYVIGELTATSENSSDPDTVFYVASAVGTTDKPIVIEGYGDNATLNAQGSSKRVFETDYASYITMKNLTITGGNTSQSGGAIYYYQGELTLDNCTIKDNTSTYSGSDYTVDGIYMYGSSNSLTMRNTKVENDSVYLYNTSKADLGVGCSLYDITADASSITLSDDVTINGTLNYKMNGKKIIISTPLTTTTTIKLNAIATTEISITGDSIIVSQASGFDINAACEKFSIQNSGYILSTSTGEGYLVAQ